MVVTYCPYCTFPCEKILLGHTGILCLIKKKKNPPILESIDKSQTQFLILTKCYFFKNYYITSQYLSLTRDYLDSSVYQTNPPLFSLEFQPNNILKVMVLTFAWEVLRKTFGQQHEDSHVFAYFSSLVWTMVFKTWAYPFFTFCPHLLCKNVYQLVAYLGMKMTRWGDNQTCFSLPHVLLAPPFLVLWFQATLSKVGMSYPPSVLMTLILCNSQ